RNFRSLERSRPLVDLLVGGLRQQAIACEAEDADLLRVPAFIAHRICYGYVTVNASRIRCCFQSRKSVLTERKSAQAGSFKISLGSVSRPITQKRGAGWRRPCEVRGVRALRKGARGGGAPVRSVGAAHSEKGRGVAAPLSGLWGPRTRKRG